MTDKIIIVAEPKSPWRFTIHCFIFEGGTEAERYDVLRAAREDMGERYNVRAASEGWKQLRRQRFWPFTRTITQNFTRKEEA